MKLKEPALFLFPYLNISLHFPNSSREIKTRETRRPTHLRNKTAASPISAMPSPIIIIGFPPSPPLHQNPKNPKWTQLLPILKNPKSLPGSAQTHSEPHTSSSSALLILCSAVLVSTPRATTPSLIV
eukprot:TRINITY_DN8278_c0_g3_i6.p1 TRINITY_DN8278_c0_g3~~TRINITY_DN8278_c0_g3_i6.p1  ORF type:complete len:127 (+),score=5.56 TRINITY_DN8278_c0_g3_i6:225-605(+)